MMMMMVQAQTNIDAGLVNTLITAVTTVCTTMLGTNVSLKGIVPHADYQPTGDVSSVIGISGNNGEGMLALSFSQGVAAKLVSRLLGLAPDDLNDEDLLDGIGEMVNMVSGQAKTTLSDTTGGQYRLSLPSIVRGENHQIGGRPKNCPFLFLEFDAEGETFVLQVTFRSF
jgi:chemotaxis protein CheX